ncbi:SDR family NAD(P)-dependent oxidoreductase [Nocardia wallacei]|uniref:Short-chain dehydrogenase/reductase n=1 Tax=Nocardia wallacei TaxID=480035 RepID=A0A7G1KKL7_9NOCA|nr:SDR family NAD(P)-dependent oxidoreductase [Nocardia wallacei]BCK55712.1 short-chain dehydrogenase/reductase [Nocardia wallacei]
MTLADKTVLVTGANRGLGRALVNEALSRGATRVYAGTRQPLTYSDPRVASLALDVTDTEQIAAARQAVASVDVLVNNAGSGGYEDLADRAALERYLAVNLFGPYSITQALLPRLVESRGAIVNVVSMAALAAVPVSPGYSISKAAALSMTQSLRATLAGQGVHVHAVLAGPVDTDMVRDLPIPKASPSSVARAIFDGVAKGHDEIFPDPSRRRSPTAGTAARSRRSNARTRR